MIGELFSDEPGRRRSLELKRRALNRADRILCISNHTRQDFSTFFPEAASRAEVTLLAASLPTPSAPDLAAAQEQVPFLLMVGKRSGYKNGELALKTFAQLAPVHQTLRLVCVGGEPFSAGEESILREAGARNRTSLIAGDDAQLAAFYARAAALLYPSRYEGFGLPVLEALQADCPVITTPCSSLPEVAGHAVIYLQPDDLSGWTQAADRLLRDQAWRQTWIDAGRAQARRFSWAATARQTQAAYALALARSHPQSGAGARPASRAFSQPRG